MAASLNIFVADHQDLEALVQEIAELTGGTFDARRDEYECWYEFGDDRIVATVGRHDLVNDRDLRFEEFPFQVSVRARNVGREEDRAAWRADFARRVLKGLRRTGSYRLMLVDDVHTKLEEYPPAGA